jgi:hypothetical protein
MRKKKLAASPMLPGQKSSAAENILNRVRVWAFEQGVIEPSPEEFIAISRSLGVNPLWLAYAEEPQEISEAERPFYESRYAERSHSQQGGRP